MGYDVIGMISQKKRAMVFRPSTILTMMPCHVKETHAFRVSHGESYHGFITNHIGIKKILRNEYGQTQSIPDKFEELRLSGKDGIIHITSMRANLCCPSIQGEHTVWCTKCFDAEKEYWLVDADIELSTFLICFYGTKKQIGAISYWAEILFKPFVRGTALCGAHLITFTKVEKLP